MLNALNGRSDAMFRLVGLALISWTIFNRVRARHKRAQTRCADYGRGRDCRLAVWTLWSSRLATDDPRRLCAGSLRRTAGQRRHPGSAASAFVFVAAMVAPVRVGLVQGLLVAVLGAAALAVGAIIYDNSGLGVLAYTLGFAALALGGLQPATAQPASRTGRTAAGADAALARGAPAVGATRGVGADRTQYSRRAGALPGGTLDPARGDRRAAGAGSRHGRRSASEFSARTSSRARASVRRAGPSERCAAIP